MEIINGKIMDFHPDGTITVRARLPDIMRACLRRYSDVQLGLPDGRTISPEQRRKAHALLREIAAYTGYSPQQAKLTMKHQFMAQHLEALQKELFSLADCDMTTAREFISYLIEFILEFDIPTGTPLSELCEDIQRYVYACLMHKKCAVCGQKAELHHREGSTVGMGRNRTKIVHVGLEVMPLCRLHHTECHSVPEAEFDAKYHLNGIVADEKICKTWGLKHECS